MSPPVQEPGTGTDQAPVAAAAGVTAAATMPEGVDEHFASLLRPGSFEAEQYRVLRHTMEQLRKDGGPQVVAVTSPGGEDGKTTTAVNLAGALAQSSASRVLLADVDLRHPSVALRLGLGTDEGPGLVGAILDPCLRLKSVVRRRPPFHVAVLPAGRTATLPYELLQSPRLGALIEEARGEYDHVVLDTPPFLVVPDSRLLEAWVDGFLIVVAANKTPRRLVAETLNEMDPAKALGLVFNRDERPLSGYYRYYYSHYHTEAKPSFWRRWLRSPRRV